MNNNFASQQATQPVGACNETEASQAQQQDESAWGRLYSVCSSFPSIDLKKEITTFGRKLGCDVNLSDVKTKWCDSAAYSNVHFTIKREFLVKAGSHALLEDNSSNGTFINGEKVGKGRIQALKSNCEISLSKKENKAFIFIDLSNNKDEMNLPREVRDKYTISKQLGSGAYGEVRLAFEKNTGLKYAIKIISKRKFTINGKNQMNLNAQIMSEVNILKKLEHPCIIKIKEVIDVPDAVYIVLDLVEGGELFDKVVELEKYDEATAKLLFYQMVLAIKYLHDQGISHRDLKPENILLSDSGNKETLIKVTDFGLSKFFDAKTVMKTFCGTPNYLAPEVLESKGEDSYTNKIDNWSLGVILYICLAGYPPFSEENSSLSLDKQIKQGVYDFPREHWKGVSKTAIDLIRRLMCVDPNKRATLDEVLQHDWIRDDAEMKSKAHKLMSGAQSVVATSSANHATDTAAKTSPIVINAANAKRNLPPSEIEPRTASLTDMDTGESAKESTAEPSAKRKPK